ncbi:MAG: site-specific integrase [Candidatus Gastranaerophilales bacterium]|nr:site-specific integrase [Candidatus Gastranaerophilales bacterium]
MSTVEPIRNKKDVEKVEKYLAKKSYRDLMLFVMGTNCGLRISDLLSLDVKDVRNKTHIQLVERKTGKFRKFPINAKLRPMLDKFIKGRRDKEPLFLSHWKHRLDRVTAYYLIRDACANAGLQEKIGTHSMRKTFGYHHYQKFKDVVILQKIFNHSSPQITLRYIGIEQDQIDDSYNNFIL